MLQLRCTPGACASFWRELCPGLSEAVLPLPLPFVALAAFFAAGLAVPFCALNAAQAASSAQ